MTSSAIGRSNPEVAEAVRRHVPVIRRAEMLAELMRLKYGIAIGGSHGKTTTTSMVAWMLEQAGLDPTAVIGGRLSAFGSNARLGRGPLMVAEADESDRSFLTLSPTVAVITNIDHEHMETYGAFDELVGAFADFASRVPFYGAVVACADDPAVVRMLSGLTRRVIRYGFSEAAEVRGLDPVTEGRTARCRVEYRLPGGPEASGGGTLTLSVPGRHNLQNALAAVAVALELGVPFDTACAALAAFPGAERRYQVLGEVRDVTVVNDYGHHPTELAAVIAAARGERASRVVAVFQPHRFSRTREHLDAFGPALAGADLVVLTDIYPAGEEPLPGVTLEALAAAVRRNVSAVHVVPELDAIPSEVAALARPGDLVLTLGAGSIGHVGPRVLEALEGKGGQV